MKCSKSNVLLPLISIFLLSSCDNAENQVFAAKGVHTLQAKKGTVVSFSIPQNKSTGYELCWMNEEKLSNKFKLESINSKLKDPNNVDGGGETITYQFLVNEPGTDTLKFNNCPTRLWQKECNYFAVDSIREQVNGTITSKYEAYQKSDYEIVITVNE